MFVSILIPVYNSEKYLAETIQSALDQSWQEKEIIVVDDGSHIGDNTIIDLTDRVEIGKNVAIGPKLYILHERDYKDTINVAAWKGL